MSLSLLVYLEDWDSEFRVMAGGVGSILALDGTQGSIGGRVALHFRSRDDYHDIMRYDCICKRARRLVEKPKSTEF